MQCAVLDEYFAKVLSRTIKVRVSLDAYTISVTPVPPTYLPLTIVHIADAHTHIIVSTREKSKNI